jgi:hypothetical protein
MARDYEPVASGGWTLLRKKENPWPGILAILFVLWVLWVVLT